MARCRLIAALVWVLLPGAAHAQTPVSGFTGFLTGFVGTARGGDVRDGGLTLGASVVVVEGNGWGAEVDLAQVREFDGARFFESSVTSLMLNIFGVWPDPTALVRPYGVGGIGVMRAAACVATTCQGAFSRTDVGFDAGGGVYVLVNESVGLRGDIRYFRALQRHDDLLFANSAHFDFWRTSIGVTVSWPIR